jgi:hypothetical protein
MTKSHPLKNSFDEILQVFAIPRDLKAWSQNKYSTLGLYQNKNWYGLLCIGTEICMIPVSEQI